MSTPEKRNHSRRGLSLHWQILIGLLVGGVGGVICNALFAPLPHGVLDGVSEEGVVVKSDAKQGTLVVQLKVGEPKKELTIDTKSTPLLDAKNLPRKFEDFSLETAVEMVRQGEAIVALRKKAVVLEWIAKNIADTMGQVFLRLIFMVVVPLVFSALTLGVAGIGDVRKLGRLGAKTLLFTLVLSSASVAIGLLLTNVIRPGARLSEEKRTELKKKYESDTQEKIAQAKKAKTIRDTLLDIIPKNPLQEAVGALDGSSPGGGMLAVMFFALVFGVAITLAPERTGPLVTVLEGIYDVVMVIIAYVMRLAPFGVAGLVFSLTAVLGLDILKTLAWYVATVLLGLSLHMFGVYSLVVALFARISPRRFFSQISEVMLTAFATSSSNATLPTALRVTETNLGVRRDVAGFVLTVGSTANQNGTALYEGITVLFLAQVFGVDLTLTQQFTVVLLSVLAGVGTAGVPGGSLPLVILVLQTVGVPGEGIGIILGVDRLLDMCRTTLNVTGDIAVAACVDRSEKRREV